MNNLDKSSAALVSCPERDLDTLVWTGRRAVNLADLQEADLRDLRGTTRLHASVLKAHEDWLRDGFIVRADNIRRHGKVLFTNYGDVEVPQPVDWTLGQPGRDNLSWQLHSMFFLKDLVRAHKDSGDPWYLERAVDFVRDWAGANVVAQPPSPFSWNDHSTAFRLYALTQFFIYCMTRDVGEPGFMKLLVALMVRHQRVLALEGFYSKGTNHGLDQAYNLYFSCEALICSDRSLALKELAAQRLSFELVKAFAEDGVHNENSPEYHDLIFTTVIKVNQFIQEVDRVDVIQDFPTFARNGLKFLTYILRPDGCWPPIGDSTVRPPRSNYALLSAHEGHAEFQHAFTKGVSGRPAVDWHAVFPASGYMIMRSDPALLAPQERLHLVFKCGYLNHYHRQDDDNAFTLWAFGEEWLADGGLYKHDHQDPQREHLRSSLAHNVLVPVGAGVQRRYCPEPAPRIVGHSATGCGAAWVEGISGMFQGFTYLRRLDYDGQLGVAVRDEMRADGEAAVEYAQYWQIPADKTVTIDNDKVVVSSVRAGKAMQIHWDAPAGLVIDRLDAAPEGRYCHRSTTYGELQPVQVVRVRLKGHPGATVNARISFLMAQGE